MFWNKYKKKGKIIVFAQMLSSGRLQNIGGLDDLRWPCGQNCKILEKVGLFAINT